MTEPLFLALLIWTDAADGGVRGGDPRGSCEGRRPASGASRVFHSGGGLHPVRWLDTGRSGMVRGDVHAGSASAMCGAELLRRSSIFTLLVVAGPISWLAYNQHFFHDPLDFIRGPYSASAIEKKTSAPGRSTITDGIVLSGLSCTTRARRRWMRLSGRRAFW